MATFAVLGLAVGAAHSSAEAKSRAAAKAEKRQAEREAGLNTLFPGYPKIGATYLSYDFGHGYQVTYYENETISWLWYPGNNIALPADWKVDGESVCWRYGSNTYNPSTNESGGEFSCSSAKRSRQTKVGVLSGDVFNLSYGQVPYIRSKCDAPDAFTITGQHATYRPEPDCAQDPN